MKSPDETKKHFMDIYPLKSRRDTEVKMLYNIQEREFDFDCTLRTCLKIKSKFKKTYNEVVSSLDKLDEREMISLLYCGLRQSDVTENEFQDYILDNCGMGDLTDALMWFIKQIQYPGLTEDEIEKKLMLKREKASRIQQD